MAPAELKVRSIERGEIATHHEFFLVTVVGKTRGARAVTLALGHAVAQRSLVMKSRWSDAVCALQSPFEPAPAWIFLTPIYFPQLPGTRIVTLALHLFSI